MGWTRAGRRRRRRKGDLEASRASQLRPLSSTEPFLQQKPLLQEEVLLQNNALNLSRQGKYNKCKIVQAPPQHLSGSVASPHIGLAHTNWTNCRKRAYVPQNVPISMMSLLNQLRRPSSLFVLLTFGDAPCLITGKLADALSRLEMGKAGDFQHNQSYAASLLPASYLL